jgi:hypothetical protein
MLGTDNLNTCDRSAYKYNTWTIVWQLKYCASCANNSAKYNTDEYVNIKDSKAAHIQHCSCEVSSYSLWLEGATEVDPHKEEPKWWNSRYKWGKKVPALCKHSVLKHSAKH